MLRAHNSFSSVPRPPSTSQHGSRSANIGGWCPRTTPRSLQVYPRQVRRYCAYRQISKRDRRHRLRQSVMGRQHFHGTRAHHTTYASEDRHIRQFPKAPRPHDLQQRVFVFCHLHAQGVQWRQEACCEQRPPNWQADDMARPPGRPSAH